MSTSRLDTSGLFGVNKAFTLPLNLSLPSDALRVRKSGIEFRSMSPIPVWTELGLDLLSRSSAKKITCRGVVVSCNGDRHFGYNISVLFLDVSKASQARLDRIAFATLSQL